MKTPLEHEFNKEGVCIWCGHVDKEKAGTAIAPLLGEICALKDTLEKLAARATKDGQHVVFSKLDCAIDELRSAIGCWNHLIP